MKTNFAKALLATTMLVGATMGSASATVINHTTSLDGNPNHLYQLFGSIGATSLDTPGEVDAGQLLNDQYWSINGGAGGSVTTMVFEISANSGSTKFGIFDKSNSGSLVELWGGSATPGPGGGSQKTVGIGGDGSVFVNDVDTGTNFAGNAFGYYIQLANGTIYYSDELLNPNDADQMVAFRCSPGDFVTLPGRIGGNCGSDEYFLGFEDILVPGGDFDYNDLVVAVESVSRAVPAPAAIGLLGLGLLGLAGAARRRKAA